jgi:hypothetical protein
MPTISSTASWEKNRLKTKVSIYMPLWEHTGQLTSLYSPVNSNVEIEQEYAVNGTLRQFTLTRIQPEMLTTAEREMCLWILDQSLRKVPYQLDPLLNRQTRK